MSVSEAMWSKYISWKESVNGMNLIGIITDLLQEWCQRHFVGILKTEPIETIYDESLTSTVAMGFNIVDDYHPQGYQYRLARIHTDGSLLQITSFIGECPLRTRTKSLYLSIPNCVDEFGECLYQICLEYCNRLKSKMVEEDRPLIVLLIDDMLELIGEQYVTWQHAVQKDT